ncbi:MAG: hypothetical protein QGG01_14135 [Roseibacillus sp.]|nr:hypothetical protein [Roseibacillus sp.]
MDAIRLFEKSKILRQDWRWPGGRLRQAEASGPAQLQRLDQFVGAGSHTELLSDIA